jgi:hypothetical protein
MLQYLGIVKALFQKIIIAPLKLQNIGTAAVAVRPLSWIIHSSLQELPFSGSIIPWKPRHSST